jgi:ATP-dependent Lhr-like helicase
VGFRRAIQRIQDPAFWEDEGLWESIIASLPNYRLSKFQPLLPRWVEREILGEYLLDMKAAGEWLRCVGSATPGAKRVDLR